MTIERKNPLPVGVYYVDVFPKQLKAFTAWLEAHRAAVHVLSTASAARQPEWSDNPQDADWFLFEVKEPVKWEGPGLPTIGKRGMGPDDAHGNTGHESFFDSVTDGIEKAGDDIKAAPGAIITIGAVLGLSLLGLLLYEHFQKQKEGAT